MDNGPGDISVIVPTHNFGRYISESLRSILAQTCQPKEIIVVDDGSTDDTAAVVGGFSDQRIKYLYQEKAGVSVARNAGLDVATGQYIAFLDSDDRWRPGMLAAQVAVLERHPELVACFTNFVRFDETSERAFPDQFTYYPELAFVRATHTSLGNAQIIAGDAFDALVRFGEFPAYLQCVLFRRQMLRGLRFNPGLTRCQDADFFLRAIMGRRVAYNPDVLAEIRRHEGNATRNISLISVDKLRALQSVGRAAITPSHRRAVANRIDRAQVDAALARIAAGRVREGLSAYARSLFEGRPSLRKALGLIKVLLHGICGESRGPAHS